LAKEMGLFVHVDTNGIALRQTNDTETLLAEDIDLLGLPLDGPGAEIHNRMRSTQAHFELVLDRLIWIAPYMHKVKINTFVSSRNANAVVDMMPLITSHSPSRWSIYQYWPLSLGKVAANQHSMSSEWFLKVVAALPAMIDGTRVEVNPLPLRRLTYPFVSHEGIVYLHHQTDQSEYEFLGSIFDDSVISALFSKSGGERVNAVSRYSPNDGGYV
jgi:MoaA/NifB/PqqE/SkfB family radical SAM enzyme